MGIDKYEGLLEKAKDFNNLRNGGIWRIVEELVEAVEDLLEENSFLAAGTCVDDEYALFDVTCGRGFVSGWKAAIEAAAQSCLSSAYVGERDGYHFAYTIRSIPMPTDAAAALDRLTVQARAQGMRDADARVAAAYERAAQELEFAVADWRSTGNEFPARKIEDEIPGIRALTPADATAALAILTAQARAQGMREAAVIAALRHAVCEDAYLKGLGTEERAVALEAKHIEDKILTRAEEIEKDTDNE